MSIHEDYQKTVEGLFADYPMHQQVGESAIKAGLDNIHRLARQLESPQARFPSIHIAGTNGKGSTAHILSAILQQKGLRVGLYTSPHYKDFRERIKINGELIPEKFVVDFVNKHSETFERVQPSFFELTTIMAFSYFAKEQVDIAVIEAGLGGKHDATNIITPILSIITNVSLDHSQILGESLEAIAKEKAGIIKDSIPVVISERNPETDVIFLKRAEHRTAPLYFARDKYTALPTIRALTHSIFNVYERGRLLIRDLESDLGGRFQGENIAGVMQAVEILNAEKGYGIEHHDIMSALRRVCRSTGFMGRMQVLGQRPLVLADSGHNEGALSRTVAEMMGLGLERLHFVLGFMKDKDLGKILALFPEDADYYFCQTDSPRALPTGELKELAAAVGLRGDAYPTVEEALETAKRRTTHKDGILVGGSSFIVAEIV